MNDTVTILTVPTNEWNEQKALLKDISDQLKKLNIKGQKELLTPKEVCEMLKISRSTFERYVINGVIPVAKICKQKYSKALVKVTDIEELIKNGTV